LVSTITNVAEIGLNIEKVAEAASLDEGIEEFSRFYLERREQEVRFAGGDERKSRKLYDEFTPRFEATVVAIEGKVLREISARARYDIDEGTDYESVVTAIPSLGAIIKLPPIDQCMKSGRKVPKSCLARCQITGAYVLRHFLVKSELSGREVLPEYIEVCSLSGKRVAQDELTVSDISGHRVITKLLRKSEISGKRGEAEYFSRCSFTNVEALKSELPASEVSGRIYRCDQEAISEYSGKKGHKSEFTVCFETRQTISKVEAEQCEETKKVVRPGVLVTCEASGKRVLPSLCARCSVTKKIVLKRLLVSSSISQALALPDVAVKSISGNYCLPAECQVCTWTGEAYHPDDLGTCTLTNLRVFIGVLSKPDSRLEPLFELLNDVNRSPGDEAHPILEAALSKALNGQKCRIVSGAISSTKNAFALCAEIKTLLGLKTNYVGFVYSPKKREIIGKIVQGKRTKQGWSQV
jgi:hypothetical protein